jgi:DNA-directed RNA polymerase specialized sigma24 family protein
VHAIEYPWQRDYERRGVVQPDRRLRGGRLASYRGAMKVMKFPRRLIRHLETPDLPLEALQSIRRLRRYLDELEAACILKARQLGASPADIGEALGITRQAVYNRLHMLEQRAETDPEFVIPDLDSEETEEIVDLESNSPA